MVPRTTNVVYRLPLRSANRFRYLCFVLGVLFLAVGVLVLRKSGWAILVGGLFTWIGVFMFWHGVHPLWHRPSASPSSCVISCLSVCLEFVGYPWDVGHLEKELRLNEQMRGTRIFDLLIFPVRHDMYCKLYEASTAADVARLLQESRSPMIAVIRRPILFDRWGWAIFVTPIKTLKYWRRERRNPGKADHAVVIFGVVGHRICVYDPAFSSSHRVRFSWLKEKLIPFFNGKTLMVIPGANVE